MKKNWIVISALFLAAVLAFTASVPAYAAAEAPAYPNTPTTGRPGQGGFVRFRGGVDSQVAAGGGLVVGPLSEAEINGLLRAIQEEQCAQALYQGVLQTFGDVFPFNRIALSEGQHASQLVRLAEKYGVTVPVAIVTSNLPEISTLAEACQAGAEAEYADAALYDEIIPSVIHADLLRVYTNLKAASLNNHLPTFESCK